jgi:hypothetical protein
MNPSPDWEVGRLLAVEDLIVGTVVLVGREDRPFLMSVWVHEIAPKFVVFRAGAIHTLLIAERWPDGKLTDDTGLRLHVFEYLGAIEDGGGGGTIH